MTDKTLKTLKVGLFLMLWAVAGLLLVARTLAPAGGAKHQGKIDLETAVLQERIPSQFSNPTSPYLPPRRPALDQLDYLNLAEMPLYSLDFTPGNWEKITAPIPIMKAQNAQLEKDKIWVPCTFTADGETFEADCRIRGILPNHWEHESYKSWRIRFPKDRLFRGMRMVNFIIMPDRAYYMEAFGNHLLRNKGLLAFRDGFARIRLNGSSGWHPYYLAEAPTAEFLEANGRTASAIFRRIDNGQETRYFNKKIYFGAGQNYVENFKNYIHNPSREPFFRAALGRMLNQKPYDELKQILNLEKFAALHALSVVVGIHHALNMNNIYYYYDDTTGLFEPIMWDLHALPLQESVSMGIDLGPQQYIPELFKNLIASDEYRYLRDRAIWSWVEDGGGDLLAVFDRIDEGVWPWLEKWPEPVQKLGHHKAKIEGIRAALEGNCRILKQELELSRVTTTVSFGAHAEAAAVHQIHLKNGSVAPIEVTSIQIDGVYLPGSQPMAVFADRNDNGRWDDDDPVIGSFVADAATRRLVFEPRQPVRIYNRLDEDFSNMAGHEFLFLSGGVLAKPPEKIHFRMRNLITGKVLDQLESYDAIAALEQLPQVAAKGLGRRDFLRSQPEFRALPGSGDAVLLSKGEHHIATTTIVPRGLRLVIEAGAVLKLAPGVSLVCYDTVLAAGEASAPIRIEPAAGQAYGVVAVVASSLGRSRFEHVIFSGYSEATVANTFFSGGLSLYSAPADVVNCSFLDGRGEDALNFKNAEGSIRACLFRGNPSDAIDLDWSDVRVADSRFEDNGGDGIDLSGTNTTIIGNVILGCGDKGVSLGEHSEAVIINNYIGNGKVGIAAKDLSRGQVLATTLDHNQMALAAYQKKAIFGGGNLAVAYSVVAGNQGQFSIDSWSSIQFQNNLLQKSLPGQKENVVGEGVYKKTVLGTRSLSTVEERCLLDQQGRARLASHGLSLPEGEAAWGFVGVTEGRPGGGQ